MEENLKQLAGIRRRREILANNGQKSQKMLKQT